VKDCSIIEHYLELCRHLRADGFSAACVFASSNTRDFCVRKNVLHQNLEQEFQAVGLAFAVNLGAAKPLLGI
jgi:hypothetical protein